MNTEMQARIRRCREQSDVQRYAFDPLQKRDKEGRWTKEAGATHNLNEFNKLLEGTGAKPAWLNKEEIVHETSEGKFGVRKDKQRFLIENSSVNGLDETHYDSLVEETRKLRAANALLKKHGLNPLELSDDWEADVDLEQLEAADREVDQVNQMLKEHPHLSPAKVMTQEDFMTGVPEYFSSIDADELKLFLGDLKEINSRLSQVGFSPARLEEDVDSEGVITHNIERNGSLMNVDELDESLKELKKANKILAVYGIAPVGLIEDSGSYYPNLMEYDYLEDRHKDVQRVNKKLASAGMMPIVKLQIEGTGDDAKVVVSHDIDEIESALDVLKAFKPKKNSQAEEPDEPEQYSRRSGPLGIQDLFQANLVLRPFVATRYSAESYDPNQAREANGRWTAVEALDAMSKLKDFLPAKEKYSRHFSCLDDFRPNSVIRKPSIRDYFQRALEERELYGKKKSVAAGQRSLFDNFDDTEEVVSVPVVEERVSTRTVKKGHAKSVVQHRALKPTEHWITLHSHGGGGGSRVIVNSDGEITGGHASLVGKKLSDLFKKKPEAKPVEVAKKVPQDDFGMTAAERRQRWIDVGKPESEADWMAKMSWQFLSPEEKELFSQVPEEKVEPAPKKEKTYWEQNRKRLYQEERAAELAKREQEQTAEKAWRESEQTEDQNHVELLEENRQSDEGHAESGLDGTAASQLDELPPGKVKRTRKKRGPRSVPDGASPVSTGGLADDVAGGDGPADGSGSGDAGSVAADANGSGSPGSMGDRGSDSGHGSGNGGSFAESVAEEPTLENPTDASAGNWKYHTRDFFEGGVKAKFHKNLEAIRALREMAEEGREVATPEEQEKMSQFVGWGQMSGLFNELWDKQTQSSYGNYSDWSRDKDKWSDEREEIKKLLSEDEWEAARKATLNSHFTHPDVVDAHWKMAQKLGFKGGRFLEPSAGIGYYLGMMPPELAFKTHTSAVELDTVTGDLLKSLYPGSHVEVKGFQDHQAPKGFYDLVASNVPFGDYKVHDREYNKHKAAIHDYFFLKSVDMTAPGGLVMHVTSTGTMDKADDAIRQELAKTCDFVSAIRFPGGQHQANAGTEVVTDMIVLRKRYPGEKPENLDVTPDMAQPEEPGFTGTTTDSLGRVYHWVDGKRVAGPDWMQTKEVPDPAGGDPISVNEYFADHPEQILGTLDRTGTMYRGESVNVSKTDDFEGKLQAAIDRLPEGVCTSRDNPTQVKQVEQQATTGDVKDGGYVIRDGKLLKRVGGGEILQASNGPMLARIGGQLAIRDAKQAVVDAELNGEDSEDERAELNRLYDEYVKKHGPLSNKENRNAMKGDPDAPNLLALERYDSTTKKARKADMFTKETIRARHQVEHAEDVTAGVGVCLNETGAIDPARLAELTGQSRNAVEKELVSSGLAFEDPQKGWSPADQYLSGNVRQKLVMARASAAVDPKYQPNVDALEKVQPEDIDYQDIDVRLGAAWVPPSDIQRFAAELVGVSPNYLTTNYIPETGEWQFAWYRRVGGAQVAQHQTKRKDFDDIMEAILNNKSLSVYDTHDDGSRTFNEDETLAVQEKANEIKEKFREWVWEDDERRQRLHRSYNDNFNNIRPIQFNGSHLTFPGMNPDFEKRDIRNNFVWQVITTGRGLAAHEVGTGKTSTMVCSAMELRRLGLAKKPCLAVLKANIEQITKEAMEIYPGAKILSTADSFDAQNRKKTIAQIATGDYDMIIMTHDHLDLLPMKPKVEQEYIQSELAELEAARELAWQDDPQKNNRIVKSLENAKAKLEARLKESIDREGKDDAVSFEETGIDQLFVDEAHKYKSLPVYTRGERIKGVPQGRSDRATNMLMRTRWLMERNGNRGVVFATGTPVGNTMAELYNIQRYLQPDELKSRGISTFDAWASAFGDRTTSMEATVTGDYQPVTRFNRFTNIPELMNIASQVMDVQRADNLKKPDGSPVIVRPKRHDQIVATPVNDGTRAMMADLQTRAQKCKGKRPEKGADNMAVICSDGRKGSLDLRMLYADAEDHPQSKVNQCVDQVLKIHNQRPEVTQLIFSNVGVNPSPETGFHLYADVIDKLVAGGIPRDKIADFSKLEGVKREAAQEAMKRGDIVVAIGSTEKLGTGVNVQNRVAALHHLDVPWMPSEIEQRDGRGYRSGNRNNPTKPANQQDLDIYRYVSEGSLDTFMWQIVGNKAHFINQIINGKNKNLRSVTDEDTETLSPEQLMAVASGDPRILQKVQLESDLRELRMGADRHQRDQSKLRDQQKHYESHVLPNMESTVKNYAHDASHLAKLFQDADESKEKTFEMKVGGKVHTDRKAASEAFDAHFKELNETPYYRREDMDNQIGEYRGFKIHAPHGYNYMGPEIQLEGPSGTKYTARASLPSIEAVMRGIPKIHENETKNLAAYRKDLETVKSNIGKDFRRAAELATKQKELHDLDKELKAGNHKEPVTPAPEEIEVEEPVAQYSMAASVEDMIHRFRVNATERLTAQYSRESIRTSSESRKSALVENFEKYAKIHAAKGQATLDFESLHPRADDGQFVSIESEDDDLEEGTEKQADLFSDESFEPKKHKGKSLFDTGPSLLEKVDDELKAKAIVPMSEQKDLFSRIESAKMAHESTLDYYAKYKPAIGQKTLEEHWITLRGGGEGPGTHVQVDREGNITAGPAALAAKGIKNMSDFGKSSGQTQPSKPPVDKEKLEGQRQMYVDAIAMKKSKGESAPQEWIDGVANLTDQLQGKESEAGLMASNQVFGHPESTTDPKYANLIPIRVGDRESIERKRVQAQRLYADLQTKTSQAEYRAHGENSRRLPALAKEAKRYLESDEYRTDVQNRDLLRNETLPELQRLDKAIAAREPRVERTGTTNPYINALEGSKQNPDLVKKPEDEPEQPKSLSEMRTAHKAAMDAIDTKLAETTKRLGSEKSRLSKSRSQSAKNQIEELEEQYRVVKQDASDEKTRLSGEFVKSLESNPEFRAQKAETAVKAKAMREKEDARLAGASEQQEKDDWDRVQKSGGIDESRKVLTAEIKQLKMRQSHTKDANEWKLTSNIANREKSLEYLESLNTKFGKPEAEPHNPMKANDFESQFKTAFQSKFDGLGSVKLADLRKALPHLDRKAFDTGLRQLRIDRKFTLEPHEGQRTKLTPEEVQAGILEGGSQLTHARQLQERK